MMIVYHSVWPQAAKGWPPLSSLEVSRPARHRSGVQKGNCEQINESPRRKKNIKKHTKNSWKKKLWKKKKSTEKIYVFFLTHQKSMEKNMKNPWKSKQPRAWLLLSPFDSWKYSRKPRTGGKFVQMSNVSPFNFITSFYRSKGFPDKNAASHPAYVC